MALSKNKGLSWYIGIALAVAILSALLLGILGLIGYLLPMIVAGFIVAAPIEYFTNARRDNQGFGSALLEGLRAMIAFPLLTMGIGAPFRTIMLAGFYFYFHYRSPEIHFAEIPKAAKIFLFWSPFDVIIAGCGIAFGIIATGITIYLIHKQSQQVENLPTSKARSAALGLSEFKGVARKVEDAKLAKTELTGDAFYKELSSRPTEPILFSGKRVPIAGDQPIQTTHKRSRFYLEDDTGRILVDPIDADFWDGGSASFLEPVCKILLTRRVFKSNPPLGDTVVTRELFPGDPVYVLGNVEMNPEAPRDAVGSDRLIVRRCTAPVKREWLNWIFFNSERFIKSRDYRYLFLLSDAYEYQLRDQLYRGIYSILVPGAIWTISSMILLFLALKLL